MALKQQRVPANACNFDNYISMHEYMRCPQGHATVKTHGGFWKGRKYLQAECTTEGCRLVQRVYADELPEPL